MTKATDGQQRRASSEQRLSIEYVRECFESRDGKIYWRSRPVSHFASEAAWKVFQAKYAGELAGRKEVNGYITINMRYQGGREQFQAHRVIWMLHYGAWPTRCIDHINRVRDDNRIENLRDVTPAENVKNCALRRVHPYVGPHQHGRFQAQVKVGRDYVHLGVFDTEEEAETHRQYVCGELAKLAKELAKKTPRPKTYRKREPK